MLQSFIDEINKVYGDIDKNKKQLESILKRDEVMVFEEFKTLPEFETNVKELTKTSEDILGEIQFLNS